MNWSNILKFFNDTSIPVWDVGIIIFLIIILFNLESSKKLLGKDLQHIKELLSNHITDTNKKIDKLETELKEIRKDINLKFEKLLERLPKKD